MHEKCLGDIILIYLVNLDRFLILIENEFDVDELSSSSIVPSDLEQLSVSTNTSTVYDTSLLPPALTQNYISEAKKVQQA